MTTLRLFSSKFESVPAATSWYLADLGEARGKQELFTRQSPQRLKALREHALIESAVSSNRIEGVEVDRSRIATIVFGQQLLRDRDEEEIRGYRQALTWNVSSNRTRSGITKPWSKVPKAGMKANTTPGHTSITFFPSSGWLIGNSSSVSAEFRVPRARKRVSFFRLSTLPSVLSAWPNFRTSARTSVWI